jgi:hypothetical protein
MSELRIGRLTLKLSGLSGRDGDRLAQRIRHELANAKTGPKSMQVAQVAIDVTAKPGDDVDQIARQVVDQFVRQVANL